MKNQEIELARESVIRFILAFENYRRHRNTYAYLISTDPGIKIATGNFECDFIDDDLRELGFNDKEIAIIKETLQTHDLKVLQKLCGFLGKTMQKPFLPWQILTHLTQEPQHWLIKLETAITKYKNISSTLSNVTGFMTFVFQNELNEFTAFRLPVLQVWQNDLIAAAIEPTKSNWFRAFEKIEFHFRNSIIQPEYNIGIPDDSFYLAATAYSK